ncbi:3'-5' exonuclease [Fulvivirgaceae bacterium BMA12]|uniref:3'-5' exonuclease n=1 Tax=Agaribacillus aureus TaxID=3051825 RepID=A0ABT8L8G9_9BACT|nr:3'-5' exonuclease [Fulvivirgaceae bacterium BMA12]
MYEKDNLSQLLFIDIETVAQCEDYLQLDHSSQLFWQKKAANFKNESGLNVREIYEQRAGIYAEFGKIVSIGLGYFKFDGEENLTFRVKAITNDDELLILREFTDLLRRKFDQEKLIFCAHNGKEFDFPYLCRRMTVNRITIPEALSLRGKKPWEVKHLDTMDMWKFGDRKQYTSLDLLANILGVESSKDDITGSDVNTVYYRDKNLNRIAAYCKKDVVVTAQVYLALQHMPLLSNDDIVMV